MSQPTSSKHICVTAIDFGTTYSGWACSLKSDFASDQTRIHLKQWNGDRMITTKCPSCILLGKKSDSTFQNTSPVLDNSSNCEDANGIQNDEWSPEADAETSINSERTLVNVQTDAYSSDEEWFSCDEDADESDAKPNLGSHDNSGTWQFGITPAKKAEGEIQGNERKGESHISTLEEDEVDFVAFGYEAERQYTELVTSGDAGDYFFFKQFKMLLYEKKNMLRDISLKATNGKTLPALLVFSKMIWYLRNDFLETAKNRICVGGFKDLEVRWVLTVPAIWNNVSKQFMREAAIKAGISNQHLAIALEPEAASLFCRSFAQSRDSEGSLSFLQPEAMYAVVDMGGGTTDITVHKVMADGSLIEVFEASGGGWGGTNADNRFIEMLVELFGSDIMEVFQKKHFDCYHDMMEDFGIIKRRLDHVRQDPVSVYLPQVLLELFETENRQSFGSYLQSSKSKYNGSISTARGKLKLEYRLACGFFDETINSIVTHLRYLLEQPTVKACSHLLLVGGLSESKLVETAIKHAFPKMSVLAPFDAGLAVLKGAVIYGHKPSVIAGRVCRYTYGVGSLKPFTREDATEKRVVVNNGDVLCKDRFSIYVRAGQTVRYNEGTDEFIGRPRSSNQTGITIEIYMSESAEPRYITDEGCTKTGHMVVQFTSINTGVQSDRTVKIRMLFGGTEAQIECTEVATGRKTKKYIDFFG